MQNPDGNDMTPDAPLAPVRDTLVEDFGRAYSNFGQNRLKGRMVGLLLSMPEPTSLDEICETLGVSKGPVSTLARQLEEQGLIRKVWVRGDRKHYYELVEDIFRAASRHNLRLIRDNLEIARRNLGMMPSAGAPESDNSGATRIRARLQVMEEFYSLLTATFERFIEDWESTPHGATLEETAG